MHTDPDAELAQEETFGVTDPLPHLVDPSTIQASTIVSDDEQVQERSRKSKSELLSILPHQRFSESDGILDLSFSLPSCTDAPQNSEGATEERQISIKLVVDAAPGCGGIAWPAGQILSSYLTQKYKSTLPLANKSILELGSGTGLVGLIAGKLDQTCQVYITDQAPLLEIMNKNVLLNSLEDNAKVAELNWGEAIPSNVTSKPDIILAADCVYFEPAFPLLVQTLADLSDSTTQILFCYKKRRKADKRFFSLLKKKFTWAEVNDDPNRRIYSREAITLLRLHKITQGQKGQGKRQPA